MIGHLQGRLLLKQPPRLLLDVRGVGYEIEAPMTAFYVLPDVGEEVSIFTHMLIREDAHLLFGFVIEQERRLFRTLIKVNGVGAKVALAILSGMNVEQFNRCVREKNIAQLTRIPGIGKKTAERLAVEMHDRLDAAGLGPVSPPAGRDTGAPADDNPINDAVSALIALGYKPQDAGKYVHAVAGEEMGREEIIRQALKKLVR